MTISVFTNRRGTQSKELSPDRSGFCLWAKRLEQGRLVSDWRSMRDRQMDWTELKLLAGGHRTGRRRKRYEMPGNSARFKAFDARNCLHSPSVTGSGGASAQHPAFKGVNTLPGNVKNTLTGTLHAFNLKHASRYLAEFEYRFNRRFELGARIERFGYAAPRTPPRPYRLLELAEVYL